MRQSIQFTSDKLNTLASKTTALRDWLAEAVPAVVGRQEIPGGMTTVGSVIALSGQSLHMDGWFPDAMCWSGGCVS